MRHFIAILASLAILGATQAQAGEIIIKVPQEKLSRFVRVVSLINRLISPTSPKGLGKDDISKLANKLLPIVSHGRVSGLAVLQAEIFVLKDEVIIQMPDAMLRERMQDAFQWCHVTQVQDEQSRIQSVANTVLEIASFGRYQSIQQIPAEITVRFDKELNP